MLVVVGLLIVVAIIFFAQNSKKTGAQTGTTGGCQMQVTADVLNVRAAPNKKAKVVGKLNNGAIKSATTTVQNNYRELTTDQWVDDEFLKTISGSCGG
ncbi:MAG TPA: SH3 domain-containing protein [Pseudonocardiaceae bacterium]|jgi:uncharacterized protein YgiM (DUF1202 family)|nr:SH3 domain-containing protein [Pseudonocardiaceae bacterium]